MKYTVVVCTRNRPQMLANCLNSIQQLVIPPNCNLQLVVVENNENPECESLVDDQMKLTPDIKYTYNLEKKLGLSVVRNTALELAIKTDPDWIWFLDDDQVVGRNILAIYHDIIQSDSADVYSGKINYILPENIQPEDLPIWFKFPFTQYEYPDRLILDTTGTGNTITKASYFNGQQHKFRFDEKFRFSGHEDYDLFERNKQ